MGIFYFPIGAKPHGTNRETCAIFIIAQLIIAYLLSGDDCAVDPQCGWLENGRFSVTIIERIYRWQPELTLENSCSTERRIVNKRTGSQSYPSTPIGGLLRMANSTTTKY